MTATTTQLDARSLVDVERLQAEVTEMYRHVARGDEAELHFEVGRALAEHLGYPRELLDAVPADALASFAGVGYHLDLAALQPGEAVLDLGSGSGTDVFCAAALVGEAGRVVGVDITDEQLAKAASLARGLAQVEIVEARIEALPFADASFDVVLSTLGVMFAPRHRVAAAELARVVRAGGRMALCSWFEESAVTQILRTTASYLPAPPAFVDPPWLWGSERHVRSLFAGTGIELEFERGVAEFPRFESTDDDVEYHSTRFGPLIAARAVTEADGRWPELRSRLRELHEGLTSSEYLLVLGRS
jgi:SAM-dependent methyltransferase